MASGLEAGRRGAAPWTGAAAALLVVGWGANQFSSLLLSYRIHQHISTTTADALFGIYALGLIPALLIGGPLSDRIGRRLVIPVVGASAVATVLLMFGATAGLTALYPGRFLAGVVSGLAFAPGTAWVKELSVPPYADSTDPQLGARRAAIALSAGFGLGPLVAGLLAQWAPAPAVVPYLPHLAAIAAAAPLILRTPETLEAATPLGRTPDPLDAAPDRPASAPRRRGSGAGDPRFVGLVAPMAPWVFGAAAISFAVLPAQVTGPTRGFSIAFAAIVAGVTLAVGVGIQPVARHLDARRPSLGGEVGLASITAGLLVGSVASRDGLPPLVLVAAVLLGAGYGTCLVSGLLEVQRIAPDHQLAGLTAVFYACTYVGFAAPLVLAALHGVAGYPTLLLATAGLCALTLVAVHLAGRRPNSGGGL